MYVYIIFPLMPSMRTCYLVGIMLALENVNVMLITENQSNPDYGKLYQAATSGS